MNVETLAIQAEDGPFGISLLRGQAFDAHIRWPFLEVWMSNDFESDSLDRWDRLTNKNPSMKGKLEGIVGSLMPHREVPQVAALIERCTEVLAEYFDVSSS